MDIAQLKTLIHVAELGSLSKAADRLQVAQPALSRQIRLLEKELGTRLFDRHGRGMVITDAGREVLERAVTIMSQMDEIRVMAASGHSSYRGTVMIGMTPTVSEIVSVPLVRRIKNSHPELGIRLLSAFSGHLLDWVQRGELDVAVTYNPQPLKSLRIVPVLMEDLFQISPGKLRQTSSKAVEFKRLAGERLVLPSRGHGLRGIVEEGARSAAIDLHISVEADSLGAMVDLVRNGFGATILPLAPIYDQVKQGILSAAPIVQPAPVRKLVLAYSADRPASPAAGFVGRTFVEIATDLVKRDIWIGRLLEGAPGLKNARAEPLLRNAQPHAGLRRGQVNR
ncbi:LysR family nitrogen assimilation transcriptional regulator [Bradyrhizobium sp. USDA 4516]